MTEKADRSRMNLEKAFIVVAALLWILFLALDRLIADTSQVAVALACAMAVAYWAWAAFILYRSRGARPALVAPIFILATSALWLYVVIPFAGVGFTEFASWRFNRDNPGNEGEWLVLRFALVLIAASVWIAIRAAARPENTATVHSRLGRVPLLSLGIVAGAIYALRVHAGFDLSAILPAELARQIYFACPVVASLSLAVSALRVLAREPGATVDFMLLAGISFVLFFVGAFKAMFFTLGVAVATIAVAAWSPRYIFGLAAFGLLALLAIAYGRYAPASISLGPGLAIASTFEGKVILRQWETVDCLTGIARKHGEDANPMAWARMLAASFTPSILWPDKPNLSISGRTIQNYCSFKNFNPAQSASATLLGEPTMVGGWPALAAAQLILVAILCGVSLAWISGGPLWAASALGLMPWLVDFDQHFFLYVANLAKAGLVVGAVLFTVAWGRRVLRW